MAASDEGRVAAGQPAGGATATAPRPGDSDGDAGRAGALRPAKVFRAKDAEQVGPEREMHRLGPNAEPTLGL